MQIQEKKWTELKDDSHGVCNVSTNGQVKFKITILKESLCDYNDAYILVKGTITITEEVMMQQNKPVKKVKFMAILQK